MRRGFNRAVGVVAVLGTMAGSSAAGDLSLGVAVDAVSQYVWRGVQLDDGRSLQPSVTVGYAATDATWVEVNAWWNVALDDHDSDVHKDLLFEQDLTLTMAHSLSETCTLSGGYIYWSNPRSDVLPGEPAWQTDEIFAGLTVSRGDFSIGSTVYYDFDKIKGFYAELDGAYTIALAPRLSLEPSLHLGLAAGNRWDPNDPSEVGLFTADGLVEGNIAVSLGYEAGEHVSFAVFAAVSKRFDDFKDLTGEDDSYSWAGASLSLEF